MEAGDFAAARADFEKAFELAPTSPMCATNLAKSRIALGDRAGGLAFLEGFVAEHPGAVYAREVLA